METTIAITVSPAPDQILIPLKSPVHKESLSFFPRSPLRSSSSLNPFCRICHDLESLEELISPCHCTGSIAMVHRSCLERWLLASGQDFCEICKNSFNNYNQQNQPTVAQTAEERNSWTFERNNISFWYCTFCLSFFFCIIIVSVCCFILCHQLNPHFSIIIASINIVMILYFCCYGLPYLFFSRLTSIRVEDNRHS